MNFKKFIESVFDKEADYWIKKIKKGLPDSIESEIQPYKGKNLKVLDLGCGGGRLAASLIPDFIVHGLDYSKDLIKKAELQNPLATFSCGNFQISDSWKNLAQFDIIVSNCAIRKDYCSNLEQVAKLCKSHMNDNGKIILRIQAFEDLEYLLPENIRKNLFYNQNEIKNSLSIFGEIIIKNESYNQKFSSESYIRKFLEKININYSGPIKSLNFKRKYYIVKNY